LCSLVYFQAAILQQTAEYIYSLEQEKTRLLSQNCHLKRQLDSQDGDNNAAPVQQPVVTAIKKRKLEGLALVQTLTDSSDEGLGSMSPEPVSLIQMSTTNGKTTTITTSAVSAKDYLELKHQYDLERRQKALLEEQLRQFELQTTTHTTIERLREVPIQYQHQEVIEHTDNVRDDDIIIEDPMSMTKGQITIQTSDGGIESLQVLSLDAIPTVGDTQVVVCTASDMEEENEDCPMGPAEIIVTNEPQVTQQHHHSQHTKVKEERNTRPNTPKHAAQSQPQAQQQKQRIPSILEAAIKAEPKVEVERIDDSPPVSIIVNEDGTSGATRTAAQSRMYLTSTSRQNLETIVEAIRHLEGKFKHFQELLSFDINVVCFQVIIYSVIWLSRKYL
jgi:transcription factor AP-4